MAVKLQFGSIKSFLIAAAGAVWIPALCFSFVPQNWTSIEEIRHQAERAEGDEAVAAYCDLAERYVLVSTFLAREASREARRRLTEESTADMHTRVELLEAVSTAFLGEPDRARGLLGTVLERSQRAGWKDLEARIHLYWGDLERWFGNPSAAALHHLEARVDFADLGYPEWEFIAQERLIQDMLHFGRYEEARRSIESLSGLTDRLRHVSYSARCDLAWAELKAAEGDHQSAEASVHLALSKLDPSRDVLPITQAYYVLAYTYLRSGKAYTAEEVIEEAFWAAGEHRLLFLKSEFLALEASAQFLQKNEDRALRSMDRAAEAAGALGQEYKKPLLYAIVGEAAVQNGFPQTGTQILLRSRKLAETTGSHQALLLTLEQLAEGYRLMGEFQEALQAYTDFTALALTQRGREISAELEALRNEYENRQRSFELQALAAEAELQEVALARQRRIRNLTIVLFILSLFLVVLLYFRYLNQRETSRLLLESVSRLEKAQEDSLRAHRSKNEFLANMSHEIRTPLNGLIGMSSVLEETELDPPQMECVRTIRGCAENLLHHLNGLLDLSKIEAGRMEIVNEPFRIREVLQSSVQLVKGKAAAKDLQLGLSIEEAIPGWGSADPVRLRQILINLLDNAVKFTHEGYVRLRARLGAREADRFWLQIEVEDTGIGIPKDRLGDIFESFVQVDASTTRTYGGTGLGLTICDRLSGLMGGRIEVESIFNKGSTFRVILPFGYADQQESGTLSQFAVSAHG